MSMSQKKDKDRSKGKGRRLCLGERIYSISCRASYFAKDGLEEQDEFITFFQIILVQFIPYVRGEVKFNPESANN